MCACLCKQYKFYTKYFLKLDQLISRTLNSQNWLANVFAMTHLNRLQNPHSHFEFCDDDGTVIAKVGPVVDNLRYIPKSMEKYIVVTSSMDSKFRANLPRCPDSARRDRN